MSDPGNPSEIAREVLRQLAQRRIQPTPQNFSLYYGQIAGAPAEDAFPERHLKQIASTLPRATPEQLQIALAFESAVSEGTWPAFRAGLSAMLTAQTSQTINWVAMIRGLVEQLTRQHREPDLSGKREAVMRALESENGTSDVALVHSRLISLTKAWGQLPAEEPTFSAPPILVTLATAGSADTQKADIPADLAVTPHAQQSEARIVSAHTATPDAWRALVAQLLENTAEILNGSMPELATEAQNLASELRAKSDTDVAGLEARLALFFNRLDWATQDKSYLRGALLQLLQLVVDNISELVIDDRWLLGQMEILRELMSRPLDRHVLDEVGNRLRDVILKQGELKKSLSEAQSRLKTMLADFVSRLGKLADTTGAYHGKMRTFADRVAHASSIQELSGLVEDIVAETRQVEQSTRTSQRELQALRATVDEANKEISRLEQELEQTSALVRHDPLTGSLNRKGLEETLAREVSRSLRRNTNLCLAMLDVDNFKRLNDSFGHATGDEALKHLAAVIRENLRPQDSCGRYGGEEFLLLLPDTGLHDAVSTLQRLQRELTRRFFLHDNQRMLITFSAGVTALKPGEEPADTVNRADKAMYRAKRAGKNRVESE